MCSIEWRYFQRRSVTHINSYYFRHKGRRKDEISTQNSFDIVAVLATKSNVASTLLLVWTWLKFGGWDSVPGGVPVLKTGTPPERYSSLQCFRRYQSPVQHTVGYAVVSLLPPGLPPRTIAWTVSSELLGFCFYFFIIFSFLCRALD